MFNGRYQNPDNGSTIVLALFLGVGFWYLYDTRQLPKEANANEGGFHSPPNSTIVGPPKYCNWQDIHDNPKSARLYMSGNVQVINGKPTAVFQGTLEQKHFPNITEGVVGQEIFIVDSDKCQVFSPTNDSIITGNKGTFGFQREIQLDEVNGYHVFALCTGRRGLLDVVTVDMAVSDIVTIPPQPAHHSFLRELVYHV